MIGLRGSSAVRCKTCERLLADPAIAGQVDAWHEISERSPHSYLIHAQPAGDDPAWSELIALCDKYAAIAPRYVSGRFSVWRIPTLRLSNMLRSAGDSAEADQVEADAVGAAFLRM